MNQAMKWIGGGSLVAVLLIGSAVVLGMAFDEQESAPVDVNAWVAPDDALAQADVIDEPSAFTIRDDAVGAEPDQSAPAGEVQQPFVIKRILPIDGPIKYGEWHWDESNVPEGPLVVTVDLEARVISVFRDGYEIGAAAVMLGTDEHPTPLGTFPILTKERHNVSEKYGDAPMPWSLRLTWDGVAIHGGSQVQRGYASHGCIGAPDPFMSKLFAIASKGDRVIITRGVTANVGSSLVS